MAGTMESICGSVLGSKPQTSQAGLRVLRAVVARDRPGVRPWELPDRPGPTADVRQHPVSIMFCNTQEML